MKRIILKRKQERVILEEDLSLKEPLLLYSRPQLGQQEILLTLPKQKKIQALAWCQEPSKIAFYSSFKTLPASQLVIYGSKENYTLLFGLSVLGQQVGIKGAGNDCLRISTEHASPLSESPVPSLLAIQGKELTQNVKQAFQQIESLFERQRLCSLEKPFWTKEVGWRSSLSFGSDVSHELIMKSIWGLRKAGIQPSFVLLEEGWQDVERHPTFAQGGAVLKSFAADEKRFPWGLKALVNELHRAGVQKVGVWHSIVGYRGGVHESLAKKYHFSMTQTGHFLPGEDLGTTFKFFYDYYASLKKEKVDFVIVADGGAMMRHFVEQKERSLRIKQISSAIQAASHVFFTDSPWNGDDQSAELLFSWKPGQMTQLKTFFEEENFENVARTIRDQFIHAFWVKELMYPVGQGWNSAGPFGKFIGKFLAFFGTPLILGDPPGRHDKQLLSALVMPNRKIATTSEVPEISVECLLKDPLTEPVILKAFSRFKSFGIVGAFNLNLNEKILSTTIAAKKFQGSLFALYSRELGLIKVVNRQTSVTVTLEPKSCDLFVFSPVIDGIAVLGHPHFFLPVAAICEVLLEKEELWIKTEIRAPLLIYTTRPVLEVRRDHKLVPWDFDSEKNLLTIEPEGDLVGLKAIYQILFE